MTIHRHSTRNVTRRGLLRQAIETAGLASLLAGADSVEARAAGDAPCKSRGWRRFWSSPAGCS